VAPSFGFFKKKEKAEERTEPAIAVPEAESLSIKEVQSLLHELESAKVQWLAGRFEPLRQSAAGVLASLGAIADDMQKEKIKLEDLEKRYASTVETARRTVVSALRREASSELVSVRSAGDAKKFRERIDALLNRMGEVSGSHSKMLNYFLKKHADRMKSEFNRLEDLQKEAKSVFALFEQERGPAVRCAATVNTITQKMASIAADESSARSIEESLASLEKELDVTRQELDKLKGSTEFAQAQKTIERLADTRKRHDQFRGELSAMFSHVSRALTKYSYNVSRETERRLQVMASEPWKMFGDEIAQYSALLHEIIKSVGSGQVQLKDSDKILQNLEAIQSSLPRLGENARALEKEMSDLSRHDSQAARRVSELEDKASALEHNMERDRQDLEQKKRQAGEKNAEVDSLLWQVSENLVELTGRRYTVRR
jgi:chromosome segregation ATPase